MASALYNKGREAVLDSTINLESDTIKIVLVKSTYTFSQAHSALSDVAGAARVATSGALTSKTFTDGVFDAADIVFTAPASGNVVTALILFEDTGVEATSRLLAYLDTGTGLPVTTNGADLTIAWDSGANRIFAWA